MEEAVSSPVNGIFNNNNIDTDPPKPGIYPRLNDTQSSSTNNIFTNNNTKNTSETGDVSASLSVTVNDINIESVSVTQTPTCSQADITLHMNVTVSRQNSQA